MRRAPVMWTAIACLGGTACGPDLPDRLWRSDNVRYFSRADDDGVCPAILDELEQHGQVIADVLMMGRTTVSYYKFNGLDDFNQHAECGLAAAACAPNATVRSPVDFDRHELIHAYLSPVGRPPWLLAEGTAVALSCQSHPRPTGSWRDAYALAHDDPALYAAGGWLVGYLLKMSSARQLPWLYAAVAINATADQFAAAFKDIYCWDPTQPCIDLDTVWAAAVGGPTQPMSCPWECGRPGFVTDGQPRPLAPVCSSGSLQLSVDVPNAGLSRWRIDGAGRFELGSCNGSDAPLATVSGRLGTGELLAPLTAGTYFLDSVIDETGPKPMLSGSVTMGEGLSWSDCASAPAVPDDVSVLASLTLFYPSSTTPQFTILPNGTGHPGQWEGLVVASYDTSTLVEKCASCDAQTCVPVRAGVDDEEQTRTPSVVLSVPPGAAVTATLQWQ